MSCSCTGADQPLPRKHKIFWHRSYSCVWNFASEGFADISTVGRRSKWRRCRSRWLKQNDWPRPSLTLEPMQSKQTRAYDPSQLPTAKRLRANVGNLWTTNRLTASEAQSLIDDAHDSGLSGFARLSSGGKSTAGGNVNRRLRTNFLKGSLWPKKYWAQIRCWNPKQNKEVKAWIALGLPHEYVAQIVRYGDLGRLLRQDGLDKKGRTHMDKCGAELVPLGLWADGVPCQWDRDQALELITLNFPGLPKTVEEHRLRMPVMAIMKCNMSNNTWDDVFEIIAWSFRVMAAGTWPDKRHDGKDWLKIKYKGDHWRQKRSGKDLGYRAALCQMRADWACWKMTFKFPMWNEKEGCCWRCNIKPAEVGGSEAQYL